jgi:uncharacterized protein involved in outer membrane biogenesis
MEQSLGLPEKQPAAQATAAETGRGRTPRRGLKLTLLILSLLSCVILSLPLLINTSAVKSFISEKVSAATGRDFRVNGRLGLRLLWPPALSAEGLQLGNPSWAAEKMMLDLPASRVTIDLWPLISSSLFGERVRIRHITLHSPVVDLEKSRSGQANWTFKQQDEQKDTTPSAESEAGRAPLSIGHLRVDNGTLHFIDREHNTDFSLHLLTAKDEHGSPIVRFDGSGTFKGMPASARGTGGSVLAIHDDTQPYPIEASVRIGATKAAVRGSVKGLAKFSQARISLDLSGNTLSDLYPILGITLPPTPTYHLQGQLTHQGKMWSFSDYHGKVGNSDLAGNFAVNSENGRLKIKGQGVSNLLDLKDLGGFVGTQPAAESEPSSRRETARTESGKNKLLPARRFRLDRLRAVDADFQLQGKAIRGIKNPVDNLEFHLLLNQGTLTVDPLNFGIAGGNIRGTVHAQSRGTAENGSLHAAIQADIRRLRLPELFPGNKMIEESFGTVGGRIQLNGDGDSPAELLATADGIIGIVSAGGRLSNMLMQLTSLNGGEILRLLFAGDEKVDLRCAVSQFRVDNGLLTPDFFVVDTETTAITAQGKIDLAHENLDLTIYPEPKSPGIFSARSPIHISGTFAHPSVAPDATRLIARGGIAAALGFLNPIAALAAFIEPGLGEDQPCRELITTVKKQSVIKDSSLSGAPQNSAQSGRQEK